MAITHEKPLTFVDILNITPLSLTVYALNFDENWCTGTVPNGGFVASCFLTAARIHMKRTGDDNSNIDPINLNVQFLRRTQKGPAEIHVSRIKSGKRVTVLHLTLHQKHTSSSNETSSPSLVEGYVTLSNLTHEAGLSIDRAPPLYPPVLPADLDMLRRNNQDENYRLRCGEPFPDFRRSAGNVQMYLVNPAIRHKHNHDISMTDLWIRLCPNGQSGGRWTNDALGFLADMFPHIVEQYVDPIGQELAMTVSDPRDLRQRILETSRPRTTYWYPTLSLSIDVKASMPAEGAEFMFIRVHSKQVRNGRFDLDVEIRDDQHQLIATARHLGLIMDSTRNIIRSVGSSTSRL